MYYQVAENFELPLITLSIPSNKSFSEILFLRARIANIPASVQTDLRSAPVVFGHRRASSSNQMSLSIAMDHALILNM
jgi:hypothetical protein